MKKLYVTITGTNYYYGTKPFIIGNTIHCKKEPKNVYDSEAIKAEIKLLGKVGYVANSVFTVATRTSSAGGINHLVQKRFKVKVCFIVGSSIICEVISGRKDD